MKSVLLVGALFFASVSHAEQYLVKYKDQKAVQQVIEMAALKDGGLRILEEHAPGSYLLVDVQPATETQTLGTLMMNQGIEWVTPNFQVHSFDEAPVDGSVSLKEQWALAKVQAAAAWKLAGNKGSRKVLVAVIDTGVDYNHKNLAANMVPGYDFNGNDNDPMDETGGNPGHGTHCAGIIGATGVVEGGIVGLSPQVSMMPLRFLGSNGSGDLNNGIKAIDYAIEHGAQVISASWGAKVSRSMAQALVEAVKRASDKGVIFVVAAANNGADNDKIDIFPANANFENTISVAASGSTDAKPSWSNYGRANVHLAAPGEAIMSTLPGDKYGNLSGTSMATPLVAGLVAFLKAQDPTLTGSQIRALLQTTGAKVNIQTACNCRIDALAATDLVLKKKPWLVPAAASMDVNESVALSVMNGKAPFQFVSNNPAAVTVDASGQIRAVAAGVAKITMTDATGASVESSDYVVAGATGGTPGQCSVGGRACRALCWMFPNLRMCKK